MPKQSEIAAEYSISDFDCGEPGETELLDSKTSTSTREQYTEYYGSGVYDQRYPRPNLFTLEAIRSKIERTSKVLDFGCGSGRYSIPLAPHCKTIVAYDPCPEAIRLLKRQSDGCKNVVPSADLSEVSHHGPYDVVVCIFGVLSHIPDPQERRATLEFLRGCLVAGGWLVVSVPNRLRRFYGQQVLSALRQRDFSGRIDYSRSCVGQLMPYHLYTPASLYKELQELDLSVETIRPESVLPETLVTNYKRALEFERRLLPHTPSRFGWGLLATACKQ